MKNPIIRKIYLFASSFIVLASFQVSYAQSSPVKMYVDNKGNLKVAIENLDTQKYKINIVNSAGKVWYEETTYKRVYLKTFDFNQGFNDAYEVVVSGPEKTYKFKLKKSEEIKYSLVPVS